MEALLDYVRQIVLYLVPFKPHIIVSLLVLQTVIVIYVLWNARKLSNIFKKDAQYKNREFKLPTEKRNTLTWKDLKNYNPEDSKIPDDKSFVINLPDIPWNDNDISIKIEEDIDNFLLKNKGAAGGFDFIKDITERNCGALVEKIEDALPWPLYIGLMGTMGGIIFGIFSIQDFTEAEVFVPVLMKDVSYAMIISIVGIIGTTLLSWRANAAKEQLQRNKNVFYAWFQTEMLPDLSKDTLSEGRTQLERNLKSFNEKFGENLSRLEDVFKGVNNAADSYSSLLEQLERINIGKTTEEQLAVINKFEEAAVSFRGMSDSLGYAKLTIDSVNERNRQLSEAMEKGVEAYRDSNDKLKNAFSELSGFIEDQKSKTTDLIKEINDNHKSCINELETAADNYLQRQVNFVVDNKNQLGPVFKSIMDLTPVIKGISDWNKRLEEQTKEINRLASKLDNHSDAVYEFSEATKDMAASKSGGLILPSQKKWVIFTAIIFVFISGIGIYMLWQINSNMRKIAESSATAAKYSEETAKTVNKALPAVNNKSSVR